MEKMGFSPLFINFLQTLYKQNISMIINNGFLSPQVSLQRGLRQGCPLSNYNNKYYTRQNYNRNKYS